MIGTRLGAWVLDREIGRGGMGRVFLAHADNPGADMPTQAAVKVLFAELVTAPGFLARFQREIEISRQLQHPGIVRFFDAGAQDGHSWFAMEFVDGPNLETVRLVRGKLPWEEVLEIALQLAPALKHAHDRGVIHRDIKPSNLLIADCGLRIADGNTPGAPSASGELGLRSAIRNPQSAMVKLTDFGIASLFASTHLTSTGKVVGTAEYLSPEQAAGKPVTRRSDLYSLGVVLYTLVTGRPPFTGDVPDLLRKHVYAQFDRPARLVPDLPHELDEIICQLMEKDPARRPADGAVLYRRLDSLRRKMERRSAQASEEPATVISERSGSADPGGKGEEAAEERSGPATLMSKLMRHELETQNRGGPIQRFVNLPWVLVPLFLLSVGFLVWTFWPASAEHLFERGTALMESSDGEDWERAFSDYFEPLEAKFPDHGHTVELADFKRKLADYRAGRDAERLAQKAGPMTEAQWFYQEGLRLRQQGKEDAARRSWQLLITVFQDVPAEKPWVRLAQKRLAEPDGKQLIEERNWQSVRQAKQHVRDLRKEGKNGEADAMMKGLQELYRNDPEARRILQEE
jgi:serine/threonine-protein kinase